MPPSQYLTLLENEITSTKHWFAPKQLDTLYFGGGTPSLLPAEQIVSVIDFLEKAGFQKGPETEVTIEINPATINTDKMRIYLDNGINRFSVGAQTFDDPLLKKLGREHNAAQTMETLDLLNKLGVNFTFDILFALPGQTPSGLEKDVDIALKAGANHISTYCLTIPEGHPLSFGRPPETEQLEMFDCIDRKLVGAGFEQYEISNYAKPGYHSRHNMLYWTDQTFWGLGLSAHSYAPNGQKGVRFWNPSSMNEYSEFWNRVRTNEFSDPGSLPEELHETLAPHQYATDFCHTSLRLMSGLSKSDLHSKFTSPQADKITQHLTKLTNKDLLQHDSSGWKLTKTGILISNQVFSELTFLKEDLPLGVD